MSAPSWLRWVLAAAMIAVALYHVGRLLGSLLRRRHDRADVELTHAAMGVAMTLMLVGPLAPADGRRLALVFAAPLVWFVGRGVHGYVMDGPLAVGGPTREVVGCAAMVYMLGVLAGGRGGGPATAAMSMPSSSAGPSMLGGALVLATLGVAASSVAATRTRPRIPGVARTPTVAVAVAASCQLTMSVTTVYMLMAR